MGRPPLPLGTYGKMTTYPYGNGYRARAKYRDYDGVTRPVERHGPTKAAAERALRIAMRNRSLASGGLSITRDTRVNVLAETWWTEFSQLDKSPGTLRSYRDRLDNQILSGLGNLRVGELTIGTVNRFLRTVSDEHGAAVAKLCRSVLSGMCKFAAQHDALDRNPVREVSAITSKDDKEAPRSLSAAEARQLRALLTYDDQAISRDLPDFVDMMLATGLRIGETAAIVWDAVDLDTGTVEVRGTVIRVKGIGLIIKPRPKSKAGYRTLMLPSWCVDMLKRRHTEARNHGDAAPIFTAVQGGVRDPSNTQADLRDAFAAAGFDWLTSHVFRKTVATLMDDAGLTARAAADQLGHAKPSVTQDVYFGRKVRDTGAAKVLESLG